MLREEDDLLANSLRFRARERSLLRNLSFSQVPLMIRRAYARHTSRHQNRPENNFAPVPHAPRFVARAVMLALQ